MKAVDEIKGQYGYTRADKILIFLSLFAAFLAGCFFYFLDLGTDYTLLDQSSNCSISYNVSQVDCFDLNITQFCESTVGSFSNYYNYTRTACLIPIILNMWLVVIECYRNRWNSIIILPYNIVILYQNVKYSKTQHLISNADIKLLSILCTSFLWVPFLLPFYLIATKIAYVFLEYKLLVLSRKISTKHQINSTVQRDVKLNETKAKLEYLHLIVTWEMVKLSTLEVVTAATLQPLVQLYSLLGNCGFYTELTLQNLLNFSLILNPLVLSVSTSILSFSWSMTAYHVYIKQGALSFRNGMMARMLLLAYITVYISARMFILSVGAHPVFSSNFNHFLIFLLEHILLMALAHITHLHIVDIKRNYRSADFWLEVITNSFGSILLPSNIKFPRIDHSSGEVSTRFHEPTSLRFFVMHTIIMTENIILVAISRLNYNTSSRLYNIFS